jgi:GT2 family glycosyltransferase
MVVANACSDDTEPLLERYLDKTEENAWLPLVWHPEPAPGKSHALNSAIPRLASDVVALVDDDHRVDKNFLASVCKAAASHPDATLFCGRILPDWDGSEPQWVHDTGPYRIYPLPVPRQDQGDTAHPVGPQGPIPGGGNLVIRTAVFDRVGRFAADLGPQGHNLGGGEDTDFVMRALNTGEQMVYVPDIVQYHYVDPSRFRLGYLLRKSYQRSRAGVKTRHSHAGIPRYMWHKLGKYSLNAILSLRWARTRFYLVRIAATLGEMRGIRA